MTDKAASSSSLMRVLVAVHEEAFLGEMRDALREQGYAVAGTPNGRKARSMLEEQQFAAVVADLNLPEVSGVDLLGAAKKMQPDATRVLLAANLTLSATLEAINQAGVQRLLLKPIQREAFLQLVAEAVASFQSRYEERMLLTTTRAMNETLSKLLQSFQAEHKPSAS